MAERPAPIRPEGSYRRQTGRQPSRGAGSSRIGAASCSLLLGHRFESLGGGGPPACDQFKRLQRLVDRTEARTYHFVGQVGQTSKGRVTRSIGHSAPSSRAHRPLGTDFRPKLEAAWARVLLAGGGSRVSHRGDSRHPARSLAAQRSGGCKCEMANATRLTDERHEDRDCQCIPHGS